MEMQKKLHVASIRYIPGVIEQYPKLELVHLSITNNRHALVHTLVADSSNQNIKGYDFDVNIVNVAFIDGYVPFSVSYFS